MGPIKDHFFFYLAISSLFLASIRLISTGNCPASNFSRVLGTGNRNSPRKNSSDHMIRPSYNFNRCPGCAPTILLVSRRIRWLVLEEPSDQRNGITIIRGMETRSTSGNGNPQQERRGRKRKRKERYIHACRWRAIVSRSPVARRTTGRT